MNKLAPNIIGIDIGGTKTAVVLGNRFPSVIDRVSFPTESFSGPGKTLKRIKKVVASLIKKAGQKSIDAIGISCGGPLDAGKGIILSPPNLPLWDHVPITTILAEEFGIPVFLQNDANACALAEWKWGAGKGSTSMIFMTFGTGLGAGLILNGQLYNGISGMAGEIGHIRLEETGPEGYDKTGSFEGFCSGGGITRLAKTYIQQRIESGRTTWFCKEFSGKDVSAKDVCEAAEKGDSAAVEILRISGEELGKGLSLLIDILNPERIIIGSVFTRCRQFLQPAAELVIKKEALSLSADVCKILPSALGEQIGDFGSLCVADNYLSQLEKGEE